MQWSKPLHIIAQVGEAMHIINQLVAPIQYDSEEPRLAGLVQREIGTSDHQPLRQPARRIPIHYKSQLNTIIQDILTKRVTHPSTSPWAFPIVVVKKKDGSLRLCIDYRRLNAITKRDSFPLPRVDTTLDALHGTKWFSTLDLASGYCERAHFQTEECTRTSPNGGLKLKPTTCVPLKQASFLGHLITPAGVKTDGTKVKQVGDWPVPRSVIEVRSFMGLASFYRNFVLYFAEIASPLHQLTEKIKKFIWSAECHAAFNTLEDKLNSPPILAISNFSSSAGPFILDTGASDLAIGAVLSQKSAYVEVVIA
ncbi:uncharacterized protein DEA37_0012157 [Paragonimus westermani]|uniref:Reverse transcriptase/retrotransposon-derived protein RNase H-like domain-containing protein n=1 Tax=Paragonimus westermani TaxID=34504 RepID=A0A5J4NQD5_9TREM|nr:uncharacterized protein DEA37_0012157 [Paragonimus westermani]